MSRPDVRREAELAERAADALLALVICRDPDFSLSIEARDAAVALMHALAAALARARK